MKNKVKISSEKKEIGLLLTALILACICVCQFLMLQYSSVAISQWKIIHSEIFMLINIAAVFIFNAVICLISRNLTWAATFTTVVCTLWSIINHYVILLHGSPLSLSTLMSFKTALAVLNGYHIVLDKTVIVLVAAGLLQIFLIIMGSRIFSGRLNKRLLLEGGFALCLAAVFLYVTVFSTYALKSRKTIGWTWTASLGQYGYMCYLIEDAQNILDPVAKPVGYSPEKIIVEKIDDYKITEQNPDIILILNESFCDLGVFTDINPDTDYLEEFYSIPNTIQGYAVSPMIGGGTNNSEYEFLTSNSMYLLNADAPFNYMNLNGSSSIVSYLKELGYETAAMHCAVPSNYSRNKAYPALGFDHVIQGKEQFQYLNYYGNRPWLDQDNYADMIDLYNKMKDNPRFIYLLSYQNHGGYEQNDETYDTIHTLNDYGDLTDDINEFMTSIKMSADAFVSLTEYYSHSNRPVLICMVGDHAPSFIKELDEEKYTGKIKPEIDARLIPYIIWSNRDIEDIDNSEYAAITDLAPMTLRAGNMKLSDYYQTILSIHEDIPIRTSDGEYLTSSGEIGNLKDMTELSKRVMNYYYMEYFRLVDELKKSIKELSK